MTGGKRKRNDLHPPYDAGGYIPQEDGVGDAMSGNFEIEVCLYPSIGQHQTFIIIYIYVS
jgi:hypothetical protein